MSRQPSHRNPWMKFYPSDWRSDPRLRMVSPAARGFWIDLLCLMHEAEPYGHLLVSGVAPSDMQLAMLTATPAEQLPDLIAELEGAGVFSRNAKGVIYSRRMTRDEKKARNARDNGKNGGNPTLSKQKEKSPPDNPQDNPTLNPGVKPQKPEARSQKPDKISDPDGSGGKAAAEDDLDPERVLWDRGLRFLVKSGIPEPKARSMIGKWRKEHDALAVIQAMGRAQREYASDPVPFIIGCLKRSGPTPVNIGGGVRVESYEEKRSRLAAESREFERSRARLVAAGIDPVNFQPIRRWDREIGSYVYQNPALDPSKPGAAEALRKAVGGG